MINRCTNLITCISCCDLLKLELRTGRLDQHTHTHTRECLFLSEWTPTEGSVGAHGQHIGLLCIQKKVRHLVHCCFH